MCSMRCSHGRCEWGMGNVTKKTKKKDPIFALAFKGNVKIINVNFRKNVYVLTKHNAFSNFFFPSIIIF